MPNNIIFMFMLLLHRIGVGYGVQRDEQVNSRIVATYRTEHLEVVFASSWFEQQYIATLHFYTSAPNTVRYEWQQLFR